MNDNKVLFILTSNGVHDYFDFKNYDITIGTTMIIIKPKYTKSMPLHKWEFYYNDIIAWTIETNENGSPLSAIPDWFAETINTVSRSK